MNPILRALFGYLALTVAALPAAESSATFAYESDDTTISALTRADDARMAASRTKDRAALEAVLSDDLHYAHSNGAIDSKETYIDSIVAGRSVYENFNYKTRRFIPVAPGVVLMTGRVLIESRNDDGPLSLDLSFLAVWRHEHGVWRFLAWQSCRNPAPAGAP